MPKLIPQVTGSLAISLFFCAFAHGQIQVKQLLSNREVLIESQGEPLEKHDKLPIYSTEEDPEVLGYVEVVEVTHPSPMVWMAKGKVLLRLVNKVIRPNDLLKKVTLTQGLPDFRFPGRSDLLFQGHKNFSSKYKFLIDQGFAGSTAQTLDKGEVMLSAFGQVAWGLTDDLTVSSVVSLDLLAIPNFALKYKWIDNEWITLSPAINVGYIAPIQSYDASVTAYVRMQSNSKFTSHSILSIRLTNFTSLQNTTINALSFLSATALESGAVLLNSSLQTGYEYILDNWDRILIGPTYYFDSKALGGYFSYIFIWDRLHVGVGFQTANIFDFRIGFHAYIPTFTAYWRF